MPRYTVAVTDHLFPSMEDEVKMLQRGDIAGAALDVLDREPPGVDDPIVGLNNVILMPHSAWYSEESRAEMRRRAVGQVVSVLKGELPCSLINREVIQQPHQRG